jgi:hypothetical protein
VLVTELGGLLAGMEFAAARLTVASVALERTPVVAHRGLHHG